MGAGLCSCHRAPPRHRLGPKGLKSGNRSPYHVLSPPLDTEEYSDGYRRCSVRVSHPPPIYLNVPPESSATCRRHIPADDDDYDYDDHDVHFRHNMLNVVSLDDVSSVHGSEISQECSSVTSDNKPLLSPNHYHHHQQQQTSLQLRNHYHPQQHQQTTAAMYTSSLSRGKPPPKPHRLNASFINQSSTCSPTPSLRSAGSDSLKSSLADVTNTLDLSMQSHDVSFHRPEKPSAFRSKVCQIISQARDFLVCEVNPTNILTYLVEKQVIDAGTADELAQCSCKVTQCEQLLDLLTHKGQYEFKVFTDALRYVEKEHYLADVLLVLDTLVEIMVDARGGINRGDLGYDSMEGPLNHTPYNTCPTCAINNNEDDLLGENPTFDIDISYLDIVTGAMKALSDVNTIKIDRPQTPRGFNKSFSFDAEDADRYIPVVSVSLFHQCLGKQNIQALSRLLENYPCIKELSISKCHLADAWVHLIGNAISKNKSLTRLDIRFNSIDEVVAKLFAEGLKENTSIKILNLVGTELTGASSSLIISSLSSNPVISELDLGFNDLQDAGCKALASYLSTNGNLRKLRIRDNCISGYGCNALFKALKRNFRLSVLDLSSNKIGDGCMTNLAEMLLSNRTLRDLNLENCRVTPKGCSALARALRTNTTLKNLDLSMNPIKDEGISSLSDGLKYNHVLDTLCLNMCQITNQGFLDILEALRCNTSMNTLKLCYNDIGRGIPEIITNPSGEPREPPPPIDLVYEHLCLVLQFNKDLKVLLWGNKLDGPADTSTCSS